ncbi:MAG: hypothetical protein WA160_02105 [Pseudobdellovibrio sp.]
MRIVIILAIATASFASYYLIKNGDTMILNTPRVALDFDHLSKAIDPLNIPSLSDAFFINHLYSNLVELDEIQNIKTSLSENFYWQNSNTLVFEFSKNSPIQAEDAAFNLHRIIFNGNNLHEDLKQLLCKDDETRDECISRIQVIDGNLRITVYNAELKPFILTSLASIDYRMIPIVAFDSLDYRKAKIINYKKTSGHYFLSDSETLTRNNFSHLDFKNNIPEFKIVNTNYKSIKKQLKEGNLNIITTTIILDNEMAQDLETSKYRLFKTHPIGVLMLVFSENANNTFSPQEKAAAGNLVMSFLGKISPAESIKTTQFIQSFGQGYLSDNQLSEIDTLRKDNIMFRNKLKRKIKLGVRNAEMWKLFSKQNPEFEIVQITGSVLNMHETEKPDLFAVTNDVSFETNFSLLTFALKNNFLKFNNLSTSKILSIFLKLSSDQERVKFINDLHFFSLKNVVIFPMFASPYITATNSNLSPNQSKFNSRTLLWQIQ